MSKKALFVSKKVESGKKNPPSGQSFGDTLNKDTKKNGDITIIV